MVLGDAIFRSLWGSGFSTKVHGELRYSDGAPGAQYCGPSATRRSLQEGLRIGYMLGLYWENGKENGNYEDYKGYIWVIKGL